jgi:hypothetical protein
MGRQSEGAAAAAYSRIGSTMSLFTAYMRGKGATRLLRAWVGFRSIAIYLLVMVPPSPSVFWNHYVSKVSTPKSGDLKDLRAKIRRTKELGLDFSLPHSFSLTANLLPLLEQLSGESWRGTRLDVTGMLWISLGLGRGRDRAGRQFCLVIDCRDIPPQRLRARR